MNQVLFRHLLASRQIPLHYDIQELHEDVQTLREMGYL
jgi:predicted HTH domain antitoxin